MLKLFCQVMKFFFPDDDLPALMLKFVSSHSLREELDDHGDAITAPVFILSSY